MPSVPGLPTSLSGVYALGDVDEQVQGRVITRRGEPWGVWYDDTTPNLERWLSAALTKYMPLGQRVMACVPPGRPHHHFPSPIISVYEAYFYGMGCPFSDWLPLPKFDAYCVQKRWPGTHGKSAPTVEQFDRLLALVRAQHPRFVWLF